MGERRTRIAGVGSYVPPRVVTNDDLAAMMDTSDEWIQQRSGIRTRHWVEGETTTSDLALEAVRSPPSVPTTSFRGRAASSSPSSA
jgi:3-oxoacyl-[acyl-carrier-protein] synthase-3